MSAPLKTLELNYIQTFSFGQAEKPAMALFAGYKIFDMKTGIEDRNPKIDSEAI
jgi:hypothetical protein